MNHATTAGKQLPTGGVPARSSARVIPHQARWYQSLAAWAVYLVERLVTATLRVRWDDRSGLADGADVPPVIFCLWHNRLALSMVVHRHYPRKLAALISASKDGALLASIMEKFNVTPVRGSSSRRGPQALLELANRSRDGYDVAVTPDGPRGPRYVVQPGVIALAQVTGRPIVPVTCHTRWKICLKSWDGFQIPLPFARCEMVLAEPLFVPRDASEAQREEVRAKLEAKLRSSEEN